MRNSTRAYRASKRRLTVNRSPQAGNTSIKWRSAGTCVLLLLTLLALYPYSSVYAQTWAELVGKVETSYRSEGDVSGDTEALGEQVQRYILGIRGDLFTPKFLSYYVGSRLEDRMQSDVRTRQVYWYDASGTFMRTRPLSVRVHARRSHIDLIGSSSDRRYQDDVGAEFSFIRGNLPRVRAGYRQLALTGDTPDASRTHITTLRFDNNYGSTSTSGSFRDEQRIPLGDGNMTRIQEVVLRGTASPSKRSTLTSEGLYRSQNEYKAIRASMQYMGHFRDKDRLNMQYSVNRTINPQLLTSTHLIRGNYRFYLTPLLHVATLVNNQYIGTRQPSGKVSERTEEMGGGLVYLKQRFQQASRDRISGEVYAKYNYDAIYGSGALLSHNGTREWRRGYLKNLYITNRISQDGRFIQYTNRTDRQLTHRYLLEGTIQPHGSLMLIGRSTIADRMGTDPVRTFEQRAEAIWYASRRFSLLSASTLNLTLVPYYERSTSWTNTLSWALNKYLTWNGQTSWVVNQTKKYRTFWAESTMSARYRKLEFQLTLREESSGGRDRMSVFLRGARIIGSGVEVQ